MAHLEDVIVCLLLEFAFVVTDVPYKPTRAKHNESARGRG